MDGRTIDLSQSFSFFIEFGQNLYFLENFQSFSHNLSILNHFGKSKFDTQDKGCMQFIGSECRIHALPYYKKFMAILLKWETECAGFRNHQTLLYLKKISPMWLTRIWMLINIRKIGKYSYSMSRGPDFAYHLSDFSLTAQTYKLKNCKGFVLVASVILLHVLK